MFSINGIIAVDFDPKIANIVKNRGTKQSNLLHQINDNRHIKLGIANCTGDGVDVVDRKQKKGVRRSFTHLYSSIIKTRRVLILTARRIGETNFQQNHHCLWRRKPTIIWMSSVNRSAPVSMTTDKKLLLEHNCTHDNINNDYYRARLYPWQQTTTSQWLL